MFPGIRRAGMVVLSGIGSIVPSTTTLSIYGLLDPLPMAQPQNAQTPVQVNSRY
jgi:hypothetical protein